MARNKHPEETVQKILDVSLKLFLEKGYEETTVLDIIHNMGGLTRGAFYHHFKSKEEVFDALSDKLFRDSNPFEMAKIKEELNGLEKFKFVISNLSFEQSPSKELSVSVMPLLDSPAFLKKLVVETNRDVLVPACQEIIEEGIIDGSLKVENAKLAAELFVLLCNFWTFPTLFPADKKDMLDKVYLIKDILNNIGLPIFDDEYIASLQDSSNE